MNWQPIETAPKDGTEILMHNGSEVQIVRWRYYEMGTAGPDGLLTVVKHYIWNPKNEYYTYEFRDPTHWMPLPSPPDGARA